MGEKVLKFERPASFYFKTTQKKIEDGHYISAVNMIRKALEKDPENVDYQLYYAELLTDMYKFEDSNSVLFEMLAKNEDVSADCFFNLGRNFLGLNDFSKARDSFEKYVEIQPEGEFGEEIDDLFMLLDEEDFEEDDILADASDKEHYKRALEGKKELDAGNYEEAALVLEKIQTENPEFLFAKNNLALAYFCLNKKIDAIRTTREVLDIDEQNIHANCNMALFLSEGGQQYVASTYIEKALSSKTDSSDDIHKIAITLCELNEYKRALPYLYKMMEFNPYDEKILFYIAITMYNLQNYNDAINYLSDVRTLDEPGFIATYYIGLVKDTMRGIREFEPLGYLYQVPKEEVKRRIKYLNDCLKLDKDQFEQKWKHDASLRDTLVWGLYSGDTFIKKAMVEILAGFKDYKAESILKRFLLRKSQPDEIKNDIFLALKKLGSKEPYVAYMDSSIVEVRVGAYGFTEGDIEEYCANVLSKISSVITENHSGHLPLLGEITKLLDLYVKKTGNEYIYKDYVTFAAALHCAACKNTDDCPPSSEIAGYYGVSEEEMLALSAVIAGITAE